MTTAIDILDEMIKENIRDNKIFFDEWHKIPEFHKSEKEILEKAKSRIQALWGWETLEDIIEDIGKRMCHAGLLYPNAWYWTLQDKWWWECKWETLIEVYKEFREELKRNWHYD